MHTRLSAVHRKLIFRLTLAAVLLSTLLGTAAYIYERLQLQKQVVEMAQIGIEVFRTEVSRQLLAAAPGTDLKRPGQQIMAGLASNPPHTDLGHFAFVALYDASQHEIGIPAIAAHMEAETSIPIIQRLPVGSSVTNAR